MKVSNLAKVSALTTGIVLGVVGVALAASIQSTKADCDALGGTWVWDGVVQESGPRNGTCTYF